MSLDKQTVVPSPGSSQRRPLGQSALVEQPRVHRIAPPFESARQWRPPSQSGVPLQRSSSPAPAIPLDVLVVIEGPVDVVDPGPLVVVLVVGEPLDEDDEEPAPPLPTSSHCPFALHVCPTAQSRCASAHWCSHLPRPLQ